MNLGFWVWGLGFEVLGLGFWVWGFGFGFGGLRCEICFVEKSKILRFPTQFEPGFGLIPGWIR